MESKKWTVAQRIFIGFYTVISIILPPLYLYNYNVYNTAQPKILNGTPAWITGLVDYCWFVCLPLTTPLMPEAIVLNISHSQGNLSKMVNVTNNEEETNVSKEQSHDKGLVGMPV